MGDKRTFANALDRHISKVIDSLIGFFPKERPVSFEGHICDKWEISGIEILANTNYAIDPDSRLSAIVSGITVYDRKDGVTTVCRPGAWMVRLKEADTEWIRDREIAEFKLLVDRFTDMGFLPVEDARV